MGYCPISGLGHDREFFVPTEFFYPHVATWLPVSRHGPQAGRTRHALSERTTEKLCRDREFSIAIDFSPLFCHDKDFSVATVMASSAAHDRVRHARARRAATCLRWAHGHSVRDR